MLRERQRLDTSFKQVVLERTPCVWLTAAVLGPKHAGPLVLYRLITQDMVDRTRGTLVAIPGLNRAGLRTSKREPYHAPKDPHRL